jgi:cytochrome oxidase Cu insertion factor (SCO1/SenC/PrrC family)
MQPELPIRKPTIWRSPYLWVALAGLVVIPAIRPLTRRVPAPPPVSGQVPDFELIGRDGRPFGTTQLRDHVYLATFIHAATCDAACDAQVAALVKLQLRCRRMAVKLWLVSFSAAPEQDSPEHLRAVVLRHGGDLDSWILLTGRPGAARQLIAAAFAPHVEPRVKLAKPAAEDNFVELFRMLGGWAVLVDGAGGIRGAYPVDEDGLYEVFHRAQHVMSLQAAWR